MTPGQRAEVCVSCFSCSHIGALLAVLVRERVRTAGILPLPLPPPAALRCPLFPHPRGGAALSLPDCLPLPYSCVRAMESAPRQGGTMPASRKRQSRTRTRRAKKGSDPLPSDDPALRTTHMDPHQFRAPPPGVLEKLRTTLQAYLRDLATSETLLFRAPDGAEPGRAGGLHQRAGGQCAGAERAAGHTPDSAGPVHCPAHGR
jgi:hypothetical protein